MALKWFASGKVAFLDDGLGSLVITTPVSWSREFDMNPEMHGGLSIEDDIFQNVSLMKDANFVASVINETILKPNPPAAGFQFFIYVGMTGETPKPETGSSRPAHHHSNAWPPQTRVSDDVLIRFLTKNTKSRLLLPAEPEMHSERVILFTRMDAAAVIGLWMNGGSSPGKRVELLQATWPFDMFLKGDMTCGGPACSLRTGLGRSDGLSSSLAQVVDQTATIVPGGYWLVSAPDLTAFFHKAAGIRALTVELKVKTSGDPDGEDLRSLCRADFDERPAGGRVGVSHVF